MPATAAPYGLEPVQVTGSGYFNGATRQIPMTANTATGIFLGDMVNIQAGAPIAVAATPTTTANGYTPVGVFAGCEYTDPNTKTKQYSNYLPANAITNGYTDVYIYVWDDPKMLFKIQSSGNTTRANVGFNAQLANFGAGSTATGKSKVHLLHSSIALTATFAVRIVDVIDPGTGYTDCIVKFVPGVHAYENATGQ